jgi:hypothetical protein
MVLGALDILKLAAAKYRQLLKKGPGFPQESNSQQVYDA